MVPALIVYLSIPLMFTGDGRAERLSRNGVLIYIVAVAVLVIDALLDAFQDICKTYRVSPDIPVTGFVQVLKLILFFSGLPSILAILPAFNLRVSQAPTGDDGVSLRRSIKPPAPT